MINSSHSQVREVNFALTGQADSRLPPKAQGAAG